MNALEDSLCTSVVKAFNSYEAMTDKWLTHAPEHYLQNAIFVHMGAEHELFLEASYKKIVEGEGRPRGGRPPKNKGGRYDLIIWNKASRTMRAAIEVKRSFSLTAALKKDAERVAKEKRAKTGYLIVYTESKTKKGREKIHERFKDWERGLGLKWLNTDQRILGDDGEWMAAFALFRAA